MKYTSEEINSISWDKWNEIMAKELNDAGFLDRGYNEELHKWEDNYSPYSSYPNARSSLLMGGILNNRGAERLEHLKSLGVLNNGRCPMCGNEIIGNPGRFTNGYDNSQHFQICQNCANRGRRSSLNPANNKGCLLALILFPWHIIKSLFA